MIHSISNVHNGKKLNREEASQQLKRLRAQNMVAEIKEKGGENESIDWDVENHEAEATKKEDSVEHQEKEVDLI